MIINPIDGQKYPVTSNIGRQVLKKYLNTYKYGGSESDSEQSGSDLEFSDSSISEIIDEDDESPEETTDDYLSDEQIRTGLRSLRTLVSAYFRIITNQTESDRLNNILDGLKRHIDKTMNDLVRAAAAIEEKNIEIAACQNRIRQLGRLLAAATRPILPLRNLRN